MKDGQEDRDADGLHEPDQGETDATDSKSVNEADRDNAYDGTGAANYTSNDLEGERPISHPENLSPAELEAEEADLKDDGDVDGSAGWAEESDDDTVDEGTADDDDDETLDEP